MRKNILLTIAILFLTGCTYDYGLKLATSRLDNNDICYHSMEEIHYQKVPFNDEVNFFIDTKSPAYNFSSGKSYFKAFELPDSNEKLAIEIKSYFIGDVLYPVITILNSKYTVTRTVEQPIIKYVPPVWSRGYIGGIIIFKPELDEKYFIIHTSDKYIGDHLTSNLQGYTYSDGKSSFIVPSLSTKYNFSPIGRVSLLLTYSKSG
ncbi:MAG: hypothetical protein FP816_20335 [Desulfobacteraceae bacterium]|nr:hypothetical protein [Desulfobacteraceae bacterium]